MEAQGVRRYSYYLFLTSASSPGRALAPAKGPTTIPIGQEAGWTSEPVWTQRLQEKSFASAGDRTPITQPSTPYSDTRLTELPQFQQEEKED
jgi:hypothetical protein